MSNTMPKEINPGELAGFVSEEYAIQPRDTPSLMPGGTENAGWLIETEDEKLVAKVFADSSLEQHRLVREEVLLYNYLRTNGVNAPEVRTTKNEDAVSLMDGHSVLLMKLEELRRVRPQDITDAEIGTIASTLARMHEVLDMYPRLQELPRLTYPLSLSVKGFEEFSNSPNGRHLTDIDSEEARSIEEDAEKYVATERIEAPLTEGVIHGDLSLGHVQFLNDGDVYIYDFSDFSVSPVIWELATMLIYFYKEGGVALEHWQSLRDKFMDKYTEEYPLTEVDREALRYNLIDRLLFEIRTLNSISIRDNRLVDAKGNENRYKLARFILEGL